MTIGAEGLQILWPIVALYAVDMINVELYGIHWYKPTQLAAVFLESLPRVFLTLTAAILFRDTIPFSAQVTFHSGLQPPK